MVSFKFIYSLSLIAIASAAPSGSSMEPPGANRCGEVDIIFTGLPPYHPLVKEQGFDPAVVDAALRGDAASIVKAGYNLRGKLVLMGPEQDVSVLASQMDGVNWDGAGVGYGVRGSPLEDLTVRLEDIIQLYRERAPTAPILFDHSPNSALWAIERRFPLASNCTSPGTDRGFEVFCDICTG